MSIEIIKIDQIKTEKKPWGYEKWIADGAPDFKYALKEILFRSGYKSSIQFHEHKEETNYILKGKGILHYSKTPIDIKKFNELSKNKKLNKKEIIINLHLAYSSASGDSIDEKKLVILQIHHLFRIKSIEDLDFDIACTIRDPIASHSSYVKNLSTFNNKSINPWQYYFHMERNFSHLIKLSKLKRKINVIKLERLHRNNLDVMKNFCIQYQIDY